MVFHELHNEIVFVDGTTDVRQDLRRWVNDSLTFLG
jgi:hypothetical protein